MPRPTFFALPSVKQRRVIHAAVDEFARNAYGAASLDRIAARAKVSKGSLYQYFDDKRDLYTWLLTSHLPASKQAAAPEATGDIFVWLEAAFLAGLELFEKEPVLAALGARAAVPTSDPEAQAVHDQLQMSTHKGLCALVQNAQSRGEMRADVPVELSADLISTLMGTTLLSSLARSLGASLNEVLADPRRLSKVPASTRKARVREVRDLLERALGKAKAPSETMALGKAKAPSETKAPRETKAPTGRAT